MNWQPIETAPKDGRKVDLWDRNGFRWTDRRWDYHNWRGGHPIGGKSWGNGDYGDPGPDPTHWMLPPEPPK